MLNDFYRLDAAVVDVRHGVLQLDAAEELNFIFPQGSGTEAERDGRNNRVQDPFCAVGVVVLHS